jgi:GTPase Era involved in 16S rRNA processing
MTTRRRITGSPTPQNSAEHTASPRKYRPAHLFLTVKVRENWADEREFYSGTGLDFDV